VFNILGTAYTSALFLGYVNCSMLQPIVASERVVFYREKASGMYSSMAYVIAQVIKSRNNRPALAIIDLRWFGNKDNIC
jgi:hypothetical protein